MKHFGILKFSNILIKTQITHIDQTKAKLTNDTKGKESGQILQIPGELLPGRVIQKLGGAAGRRGSLEKIERDEKAAKLEKKKKKKKKKKGKAEKKEPAAALPV